MADHGWRARGGTADDAALVAAAQAGDRAALDQLLRRHHDRIYAVCRRLAGNDADAADATQDALVAIVRGLPRFDGRAAFSTWAYRVATNACLDELRRRRRRPVPVTELPTSGPSAAPPRTNAPEDAPQPRTAVPAGSAVDADLDRALDRMVIEAALAELPEELRVAVVLRDVADLDYAAIAEVLAIPPGTVRSRISRGRARLARLLGNRDDLSERPTTTIETPPAP